MREICVRFDHDFAQTPVVVQGESLALLLRVECSAVLGLWPLARIAIVAKRADNAAYPALPDTSPNEKGFVTYRLTDVDTAVVGSLQLEIRAMAGEVLAKSARLTIQVVAGIASTGDVPPPPVPGWVGDVIASGPAALQARDGAVNAKNAAVAAAALAQESAQEAALKVAAFSSDEAQRVASETSRQLAEATRVAQETDRETLYNEVRSTYESGGFAGADATICIAQTLTVPYGDPAGFEEIPGSTPAARLYEARIPQGKPGLDGDGYGDMTKDVYDQDDDGVVDDAANLGGEPASAYLTKSEAKLYLLDLIHPVGDIVMRINSTNPGDLWGGVWARWGNGCVPTGVKESDPDFATPGTTGGAKTVSHTHTVSIPSGGSGSSGGTSLTIAQMAIHTHREQYSVDNGATFANASFRRLTASYSTATVANAYMAQYPTGALEAATAYQYRLTSVGSGTAHTHTTPAHTHTGTVASTTAGVLQPYITCYMWRRTA